MSNMTRVWTIADAKARLSEIMRLASTEGPQHIGTQRRYVLVPEDVWDNLNATARPIGAWLVDNMPRAARDADELELPDRRDPIRDDPFKRVSSGGRDQP